MSDNTSTDAWNTERALEVVAPCRHMPGGLLPALHAIQAEFGWIPRESIALLAHALNLSRAEVFGTASFYHDFRLEGPAGRHVLKLCRAEACQSVGGEKLAAAMKQHLKLDWNETDPEGKWTLEPVFCLGLCASGPSAMIDGEPAARLDAEKLAAMIESVEG